MTAAPSPESPARGGSSPAGGASSPAVVVWNAQAGRKVALPMNAPVDEQGLSAVLGAVGVRAEMHATASVDEAADVVRRAAAAGPDVPIVVAGGDGTLRVVARTLLEVSGGDAGSVPPIGILPLGSVMN